VLFTIHLCTFPDTFGELTSDPNPDIAGVITDFYGLRCP